MIKNNEVEQFFIGAIRNQHAISRMDNPNLNETNEEYKKQREAYISEKSARLQGQEALPCEVCSLELHKGAHIHHIDGDHTNNEHSNFSLRCPFCHYCEHIGWVGAERKGVIIYAPHIKQESLNQLLVAAYSLEYGLKMLPKGSNEQQRMESLCFQVQSITQALEATKSIVQRNFQTDNPADFADKFLAMSEDEYQSRSIGTFSGLRLFFYPDGFENDIKIWAETIFQINGNASHPLNPEQWLSRARIFNNQVKENR